jgi:ligand-binding sensor domain-containing protein
VAQRDAQGDVWLATAGDGVWRYGDDATPAHELSGDISAVALSPNGEMWFGSQKQPWLLRYQPNGGADAWSRLPIDLDVLAPEALTGLAVAPNLDLWLGSTGGGLTRFSGGAWSKLTTADGLADNTVQHVLVAPDGAVWAATDGGLSRYAP